jgi:[methyl-Co(III) methanol-specific corrinoid protein]:coenzyme M methyltransferase
MTPRRRMLAALFGGRVDRPAVASATSVATVDLMAATGAFFPQAHTDGEIMARLAMAAHEILGYDAVAPYFSVHAESAALGCEMEWGTPEDMPVEKSHPWRDPEQVYLPADFLERPSIRAVLDAIRLLRRNYGERVAIVGKVMGPWTLSYHMHGVQDFLMETITDPARVRGFLDRLKEISVLFAVAQVRAGADVICVADHATGDLVSPRTYRDFLLPYHQELAQRIAAPTVLHICGNTYDRLDYICRSGFDAFHFDSRVDAKAAVDRVAGRISLMGNVNNPTVLYTGTPEMAAERARAAKAAGVNIIGPECAVPLKTPVANLRAIADAVAGGC